MTRDLDIVIREPVSGEILAHCNGPARDGACAAVDVGAEVACAGQALLASGVEATPFPVPVGTTVCPVSLALALAGSPEVPSA